VEARELRKNAVARAPVAAPAAAAKMVRAGIARGRSVGRCFFFGYGWMRLRIEVAELFWFVLPKVLFLQSLGGGGKGAWHS